MIIRPDPQGSEGWYAARLGLPTASGFENLITPRTHKPSKSADRYLRRLLAEWMLGRPLDDASSDFMARGNEMEADADRWYQFERGVDTIPVGLCLRDDEKVGASPDRLVGDDGLVELKVPSAEVHMGYLLDPATLVDDYHVQVQGELYVTGRSWADLVSFNPAIPSVLVRCERDEAFLKALAEIVDAFVVRLDAAKARLLGMPGMGAGLQAEVTP